MEAEETVLRAGYWLDRYELLGPIASGGMAKVWLARLRGKRGFEKLFAIKTVRAELASDADFEEMFLDEARIASGIQHPNVAQILDLGEQKDILFIVMEWVDGDSLARIRKAVTKRGNQIPTGIVLRVMADACAGLHAAHELRDAQGEALVIVHRDVSPQNILVSASGTVKVIDFGIAKAQNRRQGDTRTGVVKGKPQYMAPEQVKRGREVDRRTDIWALGACLLELMTGRVPYDVEDDLEVIGKLMTSEEPPPPVGVPEPVARVLERCLVVDPDLRFPSAAVMQRAIEAAMKELGESTTGEDVAQFMRSECVELADARKELVSKAMAIAELVASAPDEPEMPFALTVPGNTPVARQRPSDVGTAPVLRPFESESARSYRGTHTGMLLDHEPMELPKRSYTWMWLLLVLGFAGVGASMYPPSRRFLARYTGGLLGPAAQPAPPPAVPASAPPPPSPVPSASSVAPPSASEATSASAAASVTPSAAAMASAPPSAASAAASASSAPSASSARKTWRPSAGGGSAPEPPSTSTAPYSMWRSKPGSPASPSPAGSSGSSEPDNPNNPYNH